MKFFRSIRFRIVATILVFGAVLMVINGFITFFLLGAKIDRLVDNLLATEMEYFLYQYENDRATPLPRSKYIKAYPGIDRVPERFAPLFKDLAPGVHALRPHANRPPLHVGVVRLPDTGEFYYLSFNGRGFFHDNDFLNPRQVMMISLALVLIPGAIAGIIFSRIVFSPVKTLMEKIQGLNPEKIPSQWTMGHKDGEIGMLSATIESAMNRIRAFIRREKQFTRDASHELRTPLTIIKGAVEIMESQPELQANPLLKNPLHRIANSVTDMETTIETFLWLAREEDEPREACDVKPVIEKAVANARYLIEKKEIDLILDIREDPAVKVREEVLYITLINLIRNAFQFTAKGSVTIACDAERFTVTDTGTGIAQDRLASVTRSHIKGDQSQGFGLGLSIVSRLCTRFGWDLDIASAPQEGTTVTIFWSPPS